LTQTNQAPYPEMFSKHFVALTKPKISIMTAKAYPGADMRRRTRCKFTASTHKPTVFLATRRLWAN